MNSKWFKLDEFLIGLNEEERIRYANAQPELGFIISLDSLRDKIGFPIKVTSGIRSPEKNAAVGGAKQSQHVPVLRDGIYYFNCADLLITRITLKEQYECICSIEYFNKGGIGLYKEKNGTEFVHVDGRKNGPARWSRINGVYMRIEEALK